jgi:phospholipid/cholesterol/gamma-HCH transport system substrate-binding protein
VKRAIKRYGKEFAAIVGLAIVGIAVTAYILPQMRFTLPGWVPGIGTDFTEYKVQMGTAQSVTPGQGQTVQIAGVDVGEMTKVDLVGGRAVVTVKVDPDHPLYRDATANLRPKTGLNDMVLQVDPGTKEAGKAPEGFTLPVDRTETPVQLEELWAALDADTRASLQLLLGAGAEAFRNYGHQTSNTLRRIEPLGRDTARLMRLLSTRSQNIKRSVHNFRLLAEALGQKDDDLASFVDSNNAVFRSFARQDAALRATIRELPSALRSTNSALAKVEPLGRSLGRTLGDLQPAARNLGPALRATRPFLVQSRPIIRNQLRPFAREVQPAAKLIRASTEGLEKVTPRLNTSLNVVNEVVNELAYNPPGSEEGYLFWFAWAAHLGNSILNMQDAHGAVRRAVIVSDCGTLTTANAIAQGASTAPTTTLSVLGKLSDTPSPAEVNCKLPTAAKTEGAR